MAHHAIQPVPVTARQTWALAASLVLIVLASSWIGLYNGFTYDDVFVVQTNKAVQNLDNWWRLFLQPYWPVSWGGDGYRPMTMLAFLLQWTAGGGKAWVFHATNIALYSAVSVAVFFLGRSFLPLAAAWIAGALFAVHPVHVEAVASIVGQAELWVALFFIPAILIYVRSRNANEFTPWRMAAILVLYAGACLSKEHGIMLPFVLLAAELTIVVDKAPVRERFVRLRPFVLALTAVAVAYVAMHLRTHAKVPTGFHEYVAFSSNHLGTPGRWWTMFGLVPDWVRLLLWPQRLSAEYGPPEFPVVNTFAAYQIPGMLILAAFIALVVVGRKRSPAAAFGVAFAIITLLPTSNFLVPTGILLAERTLFLPSAGVMLAVAAAVPWLYARAKEPAVRIASALAFVVILLLGGWRSHLRTPVWKDNETLFTHALIDAPYVYRSYFVLGGWRFSQRQKKEGERQMRLAMAMYDRDPYVYFGLAQEYLMAQMYSAAIPYFRRTLEIDSTIVEARARMALCLAEVGQYEEAKQQAVRAMKEGSWLFREIQAVMRLTARRKREAAAGIAPAVRPPADTARRPGRL